MQTCLLIKPLQCLRLSFMNHPMLNIQSLLFLSKMSIDIDFWQNLRKIIYDRTKTEIGNFVS